MQRRSLLALPFAALIAESPLVANRAKSAGRRSPSESGMVDHPHSATAPPVGPVVAGGDREGRTRQIGVSATTFKVLTSETNGDLFVIEQANRRRGGPPLHIHHGEDELFYVVEGEYLVQVGDRRFALKAGDCVLGPRAIPHAWAFTGSAAGRMVLTYAPAGKMEAFFNAWEKLGFTPGGYSRASDEALLRSYGMERIGPPIAL